MIPQVGEWWIHTKTGGVYEVLATGNMESDMTAVIVYRGKGGAFTWVRPLAEFTDGRFRRSSQLQIAATEIAAWPREQRAALRDILASELSNNV